MRILVLLAAASLTGAAALHFSVQAGGWLEGDPEAGRGLFHGRGRCGECHRFEGAGSLVRGPSFDAHWRTGPPLSERLAERPRPEGWDEAVVGDAYLLQSMLEPSAYLVEEFADRMPVATGGLIGLEAQDLADLLCYLNPGPDRRFIPPLDPDPQRDPWGAVPAGDRERGEALFFRPDDSACSGCHVLRLPRLQARYPAIFWENGGLVGPELTRVALHTSPERILNAILEPQGWKTAGFEEGMVETPGSRLIVGLLLGRGVPGALLMQANPAGPLYKWFAPDEIAELTWVERSRMTPVFSELTSPRDRLDLLAFLRSVALESDEMGEAARPGRSWGDRAPCAPLYTGHWPPELPLELLQRIPGIAVELPVTPTPGTQESEQ